MRALMTPPPRPTVRVPVPDKTRLSLVVPLNWKPKIPAVVAPPMTRLVLACNVAAAITPSAYKFSSPMPLAPTLITEVRLFASEVGVTLSAPPFTVVAPV